MAMFIKPENQRSPFELLLLCFSVSFIYSCSGTPNIDLPQNLDPEQLETFLVKGNSDTTVYTVDEVIIYMPKGAVVDDKGEPATDFELRFAGFLDAGEALTSGLTTNTGNRLLNSSAIVYANLSKNGQQLFIDATKGIELKIPDNYDQNNLEVYRPDDSKPDLIWKKTQHRTYLQTIDFDLLNFLPHGYQTIVQDHLGSAYSDTAADSVYYAMEAYERRELLTELTDRVEASEFLIFHKSAKREEYHYLSEDSYEPIISPAKVKVLKSEKFADTFIATRAFEERMKVLQKLNCWDGQLFDTYLENLHRPLWVSDSIIFFQHKFDDPLLQEFEKFYKQKLTNTAKAPTNSNGYLDWFYTNLAEARQQILEQQQSRNKPGDRVLKDILKKREKLLEQRSNLLRKREAYRMKRFNFQMTQTGWYNFAIPASLEELDTFTLDVSLVNGQDYQQTFVYIVNPQIFSLYAMRSGDGSLFDQGFGEDPHLLMWKDQQALVVGIGVSKSKQAYDQAQWTVRNENHLHLSLSPTERKELKTKLRKLPLKKRENKITVELKLAEKLAEQDSLLLLELPNLKEQNSMLEIFFYAAYPCFQPRLDSVAVVSSGI